MKQFKQPAQVGGVQIKIINELHKKPSVDRNFGDEELFVDLNSPRPFFESSSFNERKSNPIDSEFLFYFT